MSELLSSAFGGSGFVTRTMGTGVVPNGTGAGTYLTLTPPAGQKVKITYLSVPNGTAAVFSITLSFGGNDFSGSIGIDDGVSVATNTGTSFSIGTNPDNNRANPPKAYKQSVTGGTDEAFTMTSGAALFNDIHYGYEFGE